MTLVEAARALCSEAPSIQTLIAEGGFRSRDHAQSVLYAAREKRDSIPRAYVLGVALNFLQVGA